MHNIYKIILTFLLSTFLLVEGRAQTCTGCEHITVNSIANIVSGVPYCYTIPNFWDINSSLVPLSLKIGDTLKVYAPNVSSYSFVSWEIRTNNSAVNNIRDRDISRDTLKIPITSNLFNTCSPLVKIRLEAYKLCNGVSTLVRGEFAFRLNIAPRISINNQEFRNANTYTINGGDRLAMQGIDPITGTEYTWTVNGNTTIAPSINTLLPAGSYAVSVAIKRPLINNTFCFDTLSGTVIVANTCAIEYNTTTYNQNTVAPAQIAAEIIQDSILSFSSLGTSITHNWTFELVNPATQAILTSTTATTANASFNTINLPPCDYILRVKYNGDACGSTINQLNINLKVRPKVTVNNISNIIPLNGSFSLPMCSGGNNFSLSTNVAGSYSWTVNGLTSNTRTFNNITATSPSLINGTLVVTPTANAICSDSVQYTRNFSIQTVTNNGGYKVEYAGISQTVTQIANYNITICEGDTLSFESLLNGTYTWITWRTPVDTTKRITFTNLQPGVYSGRLNFQSTTQGCTGQQTFEFTVTVNAKPTGFSIVSSKGNINTSTSPKLLEVCEGTTDIRLTVNCPNSTCPTLPTDYEWSYDSLTQRSTGIYNGQIFSASSPVDTSYHIVKMKNAVGCVSFDTVNIRTLDLPTPSIISSNYQVCSGDSVALETNYTTSGNIRSYAWSSTQVTNGAPNLQATNLYKVYALPENNTTNNTDITITYRVLVTDYFGCSAIADTQIVVKPIWKGQLNSNRISDLCESDTLKLVANCQNCNNLQIAPTYVWRIQDLINNTSSTIPIQSPTLDSIKLSATEIRTLTNTPINRFLVSVNANLNGCITSLTGVSEQNIWEDPVVNLRTTINTGLCINNIITATAVPVITNAPPYNYQWTGGIATIENNKQNYVLIDTTIIKVRTFYNPVPQIVCSAESQDTIIVSSINSFTLTSMVDTIQKSNICQGETVKLISSLNQNVSSYTWYNNTTNTLIANANSYELTVSPRVTTEYRLDIITADGCYLSTTKEITVMYPPTLNLQVPPAPLCPGQTVVVSALVSGASGSYTYAWTGGTVNDFIVTTDSSNQSVTTTIPSRRLVTVPNDTSTVPLRVQITDSLNSTCIVTGQISIGKLGCTEERLTITRSLNKDKYCVNDTIMFVAEVADTSISNPIFYWSTGRIRNSVNGSTKDTLFLNGGMDLLDTMFNVIVTNGEPEFKVKQLHFLNDSSRVVSISDNLADFTSNSGNPLALHPYLQANTNSNNTLLNQSKIRITLFKITTNPTSFTDSIVEVLFDNKYAGRILTSSRSFNTDSAFIHIDVQVPCMLATNPIPIMLVTSTGQLKRIPNSVTITPFLPSPNLNPQILRTDRSPSVVTPTLDSLATAVRNVRDSVSAKVTSLVKRQGNITFPNKIELEIFIKARNNEHNSGSGGATSDRHFKFIVSSGSNPLATKDIVYNLKDNDLRTTIDITNVNASQFPLTVTLQRKEYSGNDYNFVDIYTTNSESAIASTLNAQIAIKTYALVSLNSSIYTLEPTISTEFEVQSYDISSDISFTVGPHQHGGRNAYILDLPASIQAVNSEISSLNLELKPTNNGPRRIWQGNIKHDNTGSQETNKELNLDLNTNTPYIGLESNVVYGPLIVNNISYSDYLFNAPISNANFISNSTAAADSLVNISIDSSLIGKTGHVCLYEVGTGATPQNYVYISSSNRVIDGKGQSNAANTRQQDFKFIVERPYIDSIVASLDTVCSEELTILKSYASKMPNASYTWTSRPALGTLDAAVLSTMNLDSVYIRPKRTGFYIANATSQYGCKAKDSVLITVNPLPYSNIVATGSYLDISNNSRKTVKFCENSSATLFAQADSINCGGNCTYNWEKLNTLSWDNIGRSEYVNRNNEELIRLSISINGCFDYDTIRLIKHTPPTVELDVIGSMKYLCNGSPVNLSVQNVIPSANYRWNNGVTFPSLDVVSQGGYYVEITDSNGCTAQSRPVLVINSTIGVDSRVSGNPAIICGTEAAKLQVSPCQNCMYTWYKQEATTSRIVSPTSYNRFFNASVEGIYYAKVTNEHGCEFTTTNQITVTKSNIITPNIVSTSNQLCDNSVITITGPSLASYTYAWYKDNVIMSANTTSSITVSTAGNYQLKVSLGNSCVASSNTINITDTLFAPTLDPSASIICDGSYLTLSTPLIIGATYQWYLNGVPLANANGSTYDAVVAGNYYVRVINSNGCAANTNTRTLNVSAVNSPIASSDEVSFCPGDSVRLAVTLCPGCQYQWARNGIADPSISSNNYVHYANQVGSYNVRVYDQYGTCNVLSNTIVLTQNNAPIPSIASTISEICNNIYPTLQTSSCVGCTYTWTQNLPVTGGTSYQPIFGAPNDTVYTVLGRGDYQVMVKYPNGCQVSSAGLTINDGSFNITVSLDTDTTGGFGTQICNGSAIRLLATLSDLTRCTGNCTYQWFRGGALLATTALPYYEPTPSQRVAGNYQVRVTTAGGCIAESQAILVESVTLAPIITASATALCGTTPVVLAIGNCPNNDCSGTSVAWSSGQTTPTISVIDQRSYTATVTLGSSYCSAVTPPIALNSLAALGTRIAFTTTTPTTDSITASICEGNNVQMIRTNTCTTCTYQWVKDTLGNATAPVLTATLPTLSTNVPGRYALMTRDPNNNCRDTSNYLILNRVDRDTSLALKFIPDNVLAATGSAVDLDILGDGLSPNALHNIGVYSSTPLFAYNPSTAVNPGLDTTIANVRKDIFYPSRAMSGNYLITYTYTTNACEFAVSDILTVKDGATVSITNSNPLHVSYEACVTDTIVISTTNYPFNVNEVFLLNQQDAYQSVSIINSSVLIDSLGTDWVYNQNISIIIPSWAKGSFIRLAGLRSNNNAESAMTPYLMVHNEPLAITGLPDTICSNGNALSISGSPTGGIFYMLAAGVNPLVDTVGMPAVFNNNILMPTNIPLNYYDANGVAELQVAYRSYSKFTNGQNCPQPDIVVESVQARAVTLTNVSFHPISVSQPIENLVNLVNRVTPYTSAPSRWLANAAVQPSNQHSISFGGGYTTPAGAPTHFLPANAGVGAHIIHYSVINGVCQNTANNILQVLPAPTAIAVNDTICRNIAAINFSRDAAFPYNQPIQTFFDGIVAYRDTGYIIRVTTASGNRYVSAINNNLGLEQFRYIPRDNNVAIPQLTNDSLLIEYIFKRTEYNIPSTVFNTSSYVVASFKQKIFIEDTIQVQILDTTNSILCEVDVDRLLGASNPGGVFTLKGGYGAYANEAILTNNILNTYDIHNMETTNTDYVLSYEYNGVACRSKDTFAFTIPAPLDASFAIPNNIREYCHSADPVTLIPVTTNAASTTLLVNGVAQLATVFTPSRTIPGLQRLELRLSDIHGCITSHTETVQVHALPQLEMHNFVNTSFCTNDDAFSFTITPSPTCLGATGGEILIEDFTSTIIPTGWVLSNLNPASSAWSHHNYPSTNGTLFIDTTSVQQDAWMFTRAIPMQAGSTYQIEYLMRVGDNCPTCDPTAMEIKVGNGNTPAMQSIVLATYPELDNNYAGFFTWHTKTFIAPATASYTFSFHANGVPTAANRVLRSVAMDQIIVREITPNNCLVGIGSLSGPGIVATSGNDSVYSFVPSSVGVGLDTIRYVFADVNGCIDSIVKPIEINQHPLITMTNLDSTYCWNEQAIPLQGHPVGGEFTITRMDTNTGNNMQLNGNAANGITYNTSVPLMFLPHIVGVEEIKYVYRDPLTQCATTVKDTVAVTGIPDSVRFLITANASTNANALDSLYCAHPDSITLYVESVRGGAVSNGVFYGAGVINGVGGHGVAQFLPENALNVLGRVGYDTLSYIYTTSNGCVDTTRQVVRIEPRPTLDFTHNDPAHMLPDSLCANATPIPILVRHTQKTLDPITGQLVDIDSLIRYGAGSMITSPPNLLTLGDILDPSAVGPGSFIINFTYSNIYGCTNSISKSVRIDPVPVITFDRLPADRNYCENEDGNYIYASPSYYPGSGFLQVGLDTLYSSFTYINPASMANATQSVVYDLYYEYTSPQGCLAIGSDSIVIHPYPRIDLTNLPTTFCSALDTIDLYAFVQPTTGIFTDNLHVPSIVNNHYLDLSGTPGPRRIIYYVQDPITTCSNVDSQVVTLYTMPLPSFEALGSCEQDSIFFNGTVNLDPAFDNITSVIWRYGDTQEQMLLPDASNPTAIPSSVHFYNNHGYFTPSLTVINNGACSTTVHRNIVISQAVAVNDITGPYDQTFESNAIGWYPQDDNVSIGTNSIWSNRLLLNNNIQDAGNTAWVTYGSDTSAVYGLNVRSYLYTPCFDMTETWKPMVSMDLWTDFTDNLDGATFEYYDRISQEWKPLGAYDPGKGINWYNTDFIASQPGVYNTMSVLPNGWTGKSKEWKNSRYRLDQFAGQENVQFRIAFATASNTVLFSNPQGMALDNFWIGERTQNILIEHFSYFNLSNVDDIDQSVYNKVYSNNYGRDVELIQYNLEKYGVNSLVDSLYLSSQVGTNARAYSYSNLTTPNRFVMNGIFREDSVSSTMSEELLELEMLKTPRFIIHTPIFRVNGYNLDIEVNATGNTYNDYENMNFYVMLTEDGVPSQATSAAVPYQLKSVFRKMLDPLDISGANWYGKVINYTSSIPVRDLNINTFANMNIVAFIQRGDYQELPEIYQVRSTRDLSIYGYDPAYPTTPTGVNPVVDETSTMKLYPNPTTEFFNVSFSNALETEHEWLLVDMLGRVINQGKTTIGTTQMRVETNELPSGSYMFVIKNASVLTQRQVIVARP